MIIHVLEKARAISAIERVVITCPEAHLAATEELIANHRLGAKFTCIVGGGSRQESVLQRAAARSTGIDSVIVHEAVRPLVTVDAFKALIDDEHENAMYGIPIPFTVIKGHDYVEGILDRDELVNVQLPAEVRPGQAASARTKRRGATARGSPRTPGSSTSTSASRSASSRARTRTSRSRFPTDTVTAEAIYADFLGRGR